MEVQPHHQQRKICPSRAKYREGRNPRAVKVYTINLESTYLLVQGVPAIGVMNELVESFALYGTIQEFNILHEYPAEEFTEVYLIKFQRLQSARVAKRKLDERSFFGGLLHVCYAPEYESVQETREKLQDRRRYVAWATSKKEKKLDTPDNPTVISVDSELNSAATSSCDSTIKPSIPPPPFYPLPPPAAWDYEQNYYLPVQPSNPPPPSYALPPPAAWDYDQNYYPPVQPSNPPPPSYALPPPAAWDYDQNYYPPVQSSPCESRSKATDGTPHMERIIGPAGNRPHVVGTATRFMPRTTQLQERQRRREESTALALSLPESTEIVIGPKLPEIPKLDLEDASLNLSADLIRGKLKQASAPHAVTAPDPTAADLPSAPPPKQRRRI
ncbi:RNA-binding protein 48 [Hyperolius riggenbachi]|uniref:RNA-binding protein 48 n=1 Tax=Hyperolius riggenbachi TaxID=752182 RepID=UPI0035A37818